MKIIKSILEGELRKSLQKQAEFEKTLAALPRGVLVKKFVKGYQYFFLMMREGKKVRFEYKGKLFARDIKFYDNARKERATYRKLLREVKKQIAFLRKTLKGKDLRAS